MKKRRKAKVTRNEHVLARQGLVVLKWLLVVCVLLLVLIALQKLNERSVAGLAQEHSVIAAGLVLTPLLWRWKPGRT